MSLNEALAVVKSAGYRVTAPRVRNPVRVPRLNAVGKPYSPQFDPNYRMKYKPPKYAGKGPNLGGMQFTVPSETGVPRQWDLS